MAAPDDAVEVLLDYRREVDANRLISVKVLSVPESSKFPDGVKYRMHFGEKTGETLLRDDNSHGHHERHTTDGVEEIDYPCLARLYDRFQAEIQQFR